MSEVNPDSRPDPDALLLRIRNEETRAGRAALKIFLGYAPGVGKTYTMLEAARRMTEQGMDVVVGYVETHARLETAELLLGLEILPRRTIAYRDTAVAEFDLDAALERKPALVLVDELPHSNVSGSRHAKRWQDVLELLDAGIDVYTTLNVQHVESLNDVVAQITSVQVRETVPDSFLERADDIELVDLAPDDLLERLRDGKVYIPEQARRAADHFFQRGNLLALRELALRRAASFVNADVQAYRRAHAITSTWQSSERILACVGASPSSDRVIRAARRIAEGMRAPWIAAYVDAADARPLGEHDRERLQAHLRLAESLGGEVVRLDGPAIAEAVLAYGRAHDVTRIVVGKPTHPSRRDLLRGSLVTRLVRGSGDIEIHFIAGESPRSATESRTARAHAPEWKGMVLALALVAVATGLGKLVVPYVSQPDVVMVYVLAVMATAFRYGRGASTVAAALAVAAYDFFFVPPLHTFNIAHAKYALTFAVMFGLGIAISTLMNRLRRREAEARVREERTAALYALTRALASVGDERAAAEVAARHAAGLFGGEAAVWVRDGDGTLRLAARSTGAGDLSDDEFAVVRWSCDNGRPAGRGTDTLPGSRVTCVPMRTRQEAIGVLALTDPDPELLSVENRAFLDAFVRQAAISVERAHLTEETKTAALRVRTEETRSSLLSAVSHDLRTPLAVITGAATALRENAGAMNTAEREELVSGICSEAARMERLVANVLDMVRIDSGGFVPKREWVPLEEIVGSALARFDEQWSGRPLALDLPADLPSISVDPVLLEQVFVNLLDNALRYAGPDAGIAIRARATDDGVHIEVTDEGPGFPIGEETLVLEKFHRGSAAGGGVGLGLPICLGIVRAHGGTLVAANRPEGGAVVRIVLPREENAHVPDPLPHAEGSGDVSE